MGARGPKRTPTAQLKASGSWRGNDREQTEADPRDGTPTAPTILDAEGKREWNRLSASLKHMGMLSPDFRGCMFNACQHWSVMYREAKAINEAVAAGPVDTDKLYKKQRMYNDASAAYMRCIASMGLTPADRSRVIVKKPEEKKSGKSRFFGKAV